MTTSPSRRALAGRWLALVAVLAWPAGARAQELADIVPSDAYFYWHLERTPEGETIAAYHREMLQAVLDARFDELCLELVGQLATPEEAATARALRDYVAYLLDGVPWAELVEHEVVVGDVFHLPGPDVGPIPINGVVVGFRVDADSRDAVHAGLRRLLSAGADMTGGRLALKLLRDDGSGLATVDEPQGATGEAPPLADGVALVYDLAWYRGGARVPLLQLGFCDDFVVLGSNPFNGGPVGPSLDVLRGRSPSWRSIRDTERFQRALAGDDPHELLYLDFRNLFEPLEQVTLAVLPFLAEEALQDGQAFDVARRLTGQVWDLLRDFESVVCCTRTEGLVRTAETTFRMAATEAALENPFCLMSSGDVEEASDLLAYVPSSATSFAVSGGVDLGPLAQWAGDRLREAVPDAEKWLASAGALEAVVDIDFERDVLGMFRGASVVMTLPARRPSPMQPYDTVTIVKPHDVQRSRELYDRLDDILTAVELSWDDMLAGMRAVMQQTPPFARVDFELRDAEPPYSHLRRLDVRHVMGTTSTYFGFVGGLYVMSSSADALGYVLETVAGEHAIALEEHAQLRADAFPEGRLHAASFTSYADQPDVTLQALGLVQAGISSATIAAAQELPEAQRPVLSTVRNVVPKVMDVVRHFDFVDHRVSWTQVRDGGRTVVTRDVTYYRPPEERAKR